MKTFSIRVASVEDCLLISELAYRTWYHTYGEIHSREQLDYMFEQMYNPALLKDEIEQDKCNFILVYDEAEPVGYASFGPSGADLFYLHKLYVLPEYQGTGAGKFLFNAVISMIKKQHPFPCTLQLNVNRKNKAIFFYRKMGMEIIRESDDEIGNGYVMNNCFMSIEI